MALLMGKLGSCAGASNNARDAAQGWQQTKNKYFLFIVRSLERDYTELLLKAFKDCGPVLCGDLIIFMEFEMSMFFKYTI